MNIQVEKEMQNTEFKQHRMKYNDDDDDDDDDDANQIEQDDFDDNDRIENPLERHRTLSWPTSPGIRHNPLPTTTEVAAPVTSPRGEEEGRLNSSAITETTKSPLSPTQHPQPPQQQEEMSALPPAQEASSPPPAPPPPIAPPKPIKLIKSTRLKGYMTLTLAAFINLDAARTSSNIDTNAITIVPSTDAQRLYAQITAIISLIGTTICCLIHFDRITPLQNKVWIPILFHTNGTSIYEGGMIIFYTLWWGIATGIATSVNGIAGDGKGQYSLYYSTWACCLTSFWLLERWFVASGWVRMLHTIIPHFPNFCLCNGGTLHLYIHSFLLERFHSYSILLSSVKFQFFHC